MGTRYYPGMEQKSQDRMQELWDLCVEFVKDSGVKTADDAHQLDRIPAYTFIQDVCDIVGYTEGEGT